MVGIATLLFTRCVPDSECSLLLNKVPNPSDHLTIKDQLVGDTLRHAMCQVQLLKPETCSPRGLLLPPQHYSYRLPLFDPLLVCQVLLQLSTDRATVSSTLFNNLLIACA